MCWMWSTFGLARRRVRRGGPGYFAAIKTDIVELVNGDRITCEIQKLDRGKLPSRPTASARSRLSGTTSCTCRARLGTTSSLRPGPGVRHACPGRQANRDVVEGRRNRTVRVGTSKDGRSEARSGGGSMVRFCRLQLYRSERSDAVDVRLERELSQSPMADSARRRLACSTINEDADRQSRNDLAAVTAFPPAHGGRRSGSAVSAERRAVAEPAVARWRRVSRILTPVRTGTLVTALTGAAFDPASSIRAKTSSMCAEVVAEDLGVVHLRRRSTNLGTSTSPTTRSNLDSRLRLELNTSFKSDIVGDLYWSINAFESFNSQPPTDQKKERLRRIGDCRLDFLSHGTPGHELGLDPEPYIVSARARRRGACQARGSA